MAKSTSKTVKSKVFLIDFTRDQKQLLTVYCKRHKQKISEFLRKIALEDIAVAAKNQTRNITIKLTLPLNYEEQQKLRLFADLEDTDPDEFVSSVIKDAIYQALHRHQISRVKRESYAISFELLEEDFDAITQHVARLNVSARKYIPLLAMQAIAKNHGKTRA